MLTSFSKVKSCRAIILNSKPFFEKDKWIDLYSLEMGRFRALAKAASTCKSSLNGVLSAFTVVKLHIYHAKTFPLITEASLIKANDGIRSDFNRISMACFFADIVKSVAADLHPNDTLFGLLETALDHLNEGFPLPKVKRDFCMAFLQCEGLWDDQNPPSDIDFLKIMFDYCGRTLKAPLLLEG
jgi:DNA repair protein RecO